MIFRFLSGVFILGMMQVAAVGVEPSLSGIAPSPEITTGVREWRLTDGSRQRLRFVKFGRDGSNGDFVSTAPGLKILPLMMFSGEDQAYLKAIREKRVRIVENQGLSLVPFPQTGKVDLDEASRRGNWLGAKRTWERIDGRKVEGCLFSLADDQISLAVNGSISILKLEQLSTADLEYIGQIKRGEARLYPTRIRLEPSGHLPSTTVISVSGERFFAAKRDPVTFGTARKIALDLVSSRLKPDQYELYSFSEIPCKSPPSPVAAGFLPAISGTKPAAHLASPVFYVANFMLRRSGNEEADKLWPPLLSPKDRNYDRELTIVVFEDGQLADSQSLPTSQQ